MKTVTITPNSWEKCAAFTLQEGDKVIVVDTRGIRWVGRPPILSVHKVTRMGGTKRQWIELDDKTKWKLDGQRLDGELEQNLVGFEEELLVKNREEWFEYNEIRGLVRGLRDLDLTRLAHELKKPEVRTAVKAFLALLPTPKPPPPDDI